MEYKISNIRKESRGILCNGKWYNYTKNLDDIANKLSVGDTIELEFWEDSGRIKKIIPLKKSEDIKKYADDFKDLTDKVEEKQNEEKSTWEVKNDIDKDRLEFEKQKQEYFYRERCQERAIQFMQKENYNISKDSMALVCRLAHQLYNDLMQNKNWSKTEALPESKIDDNKI